MTSTIPPGRAHDEERRGNRNGSLTTRVGTCVPIHLGIPDLPAPLRAESCDVGTGGAGLTTRSPFAISGINEAQIELPSGPIRVQAKGRWQRLVSPGEALLSGIEFLDLPREPKYRLWEFVQEQARNLARFLHEDSELSDLDLEGAMDLALYTRLRRLPAGHRIYTQSEYELGSGSIFILYEGSVVLQAQPVGSRDVWLERLQSGAMFGGLPLVTGIAGLETAVSATNSTLLEIDDYTFHYLEAARPPLARFLTQAALRKPASHLKNLICRVADYMKHQS